MKQPDGDPTGRTRYSASGSRRKRLLRVTDDSGRSLGFVYYTRGQDSAAFTGLLKEVRGPAGIRVQFAYVRPPFAPHFLNEAFLATVRRDDLAPGDGQPPSLRRAADRNYRYEYAWQDAETRWFQDWAWIVWRQLSEREEPAAPWAAGQYLSDSLDNIIRVWRNIETSDIQRESETHYESSPLRPDFDRVIEQRYGAMESARSPEPVVVDSYTVMRWRVGGPRHRLEYGLASIGRMEALLPSEIRERYPLEPLLAPLAGRRRVPFYPYFPVTDSGENLRLRRARVSAEQIAAVSRYVGLDMRVEPGAAEDTYRSVFAGGWRAEGFAFSEARVASDANRITSWLKSRDRESRTTYYGLNFLGQPLVTARAAPNDLRVVGDEFLYEERLYDGHGRLTSTRYPTRAFATLPQPDVDLPPGLGAVRRPAPVRPLDPRRFHAQAAAHTTMRYPEALAAADFDAGRWRARFNLLETRRRPIGGPVMAVSDGVAAPTAEEYRTFVYEPTFQQPVLVDTGTLSASGQRRSTYQGAWDFGCAGSGAPRDDARSAVDRANDCRAPRPLRLVMGRGPLFVGPAALVPPTARVVQFEWNATGAPTRVAERGGTTIELAYFARFAQGAVGPEGAGFLARRIASAALTAAVPGPDDPPCPGLAGALQWLLPGSCQDPPAELGAIGFDAEALRVFDEARTSGTREEFAYFPATGHLSRVVRDRSETTYVRDTDGRVLETREPLSGVRVHEYALSGRPTRVLIRGDAGKLWERVIRYDGADRIVGVVDQPSAGGWSWSAGYSPEGRVARTIRGRPCGHRARIRQPRPPDPLLQAVAERGRPSAPDAIRIRRPRARPPDRSGAGSGGQRRRRRNVRVRRLRPARA